MRREDHRHGIYGYLLDPAVRVAGVARFRSASGRAATVASCSRPAQERRAGLPVAATAAQLRSADSVVSARRPGRGVTQLSAATTDADPLWRPACAAHA